MYLLHVPRSNVPRSNVNIQIEKLVHNFIMTVMVTFALYVTINQILAIETVMTYNGSKLNVNMTIERPHMAMYHENGNVYSIRYILLDIRTRNVQDFVLYRP